MSWGLTSRMWTGLSRFRYRTSLILVIETSSAIAGDWVMDFIARDWARLYWVWLIDSSDEIIFTLYERFYIFSGLLLRYRIGGKFVRENMLRLMWLVRDVNLKVARLAHLFCSRWVALILNYNVQRVEVFLGIANLSTVSKEFTCSALTRSVL